MGRIGWQRAETCSTPATAPADASDRIRPGHVSTSGTISIRASGRLHYVAIGRTHAGTRVLVLTRGLDITIIHAATGELLRQLTLDLTRAYQPTGAPRGRLPHPK